MADDIERLANWYGGSRLEGVSTSGNETLTRYATATSDSMGGEVRVRMINSADEEILVPSTMKNLRKGESVIITATGGSTKTPMVTGVVEDDLVSQRCKVLYEATENVINMDSPVELNENPDNFEYLEIYYYLAYTNGLQGSSKVWKSKIYDQTGPETGSFDNVRVALTIPRFNESSGSATLDVFVTNVEIDVENHAIRRVDNSGYADFWADGGQGYSSSSYIVYPIDEPEAEEPTITKVVGYR